jgi:transcriptional regulator with XRE-family HTH domain
MTTLIMVDTTKPGSRDEDIVRRLREELARLGGLSISEVARRTGMTQQALSMRMNLIVDFRTSELDIICSAVGASWEYVMAGIRVAPPQPGLPVMPHSASRRRKGVRKLPRLDSNQEPIGYRPYGYYRNAS